MKANYHTHTSRCGHAVGEDREYVESAIAHGMKVLGFSDHCPWIYDDGYVSASRMHPNQLDDYFKSLTDLKKEYASDIKIYIGFEAEYHPDMMEAQDRLLADYPVDYMILGEHSIKREPFAPYTAEPNTDAESFTRYIDLVIEGMESGRYKYAAHPDIYNFIGDAEIYDREYKRLCRYLKSKDIPVEINMLGVNEGRNYTSERFLRIAAEIGNRAIIGCDAHSPSALCDTAAMEKCIRLAENAGLEITDYISGLK